VSFFTSITHTSCEQILNQHPQFPLNLTVFLSYRHLLRHVHGLGRLLLRLHEGKLVALSGDLGVVVIDSV
jgi:hypothetical protein